MAVVVLGGLLTSLALNMVVVPVLFVRYGGVKEGVEADAQPHRKEALYAQRRALSVVRGPVQLLLLDAGVLPILQRAPDGRSGVASGGDLLRRSRRARGAVRLLLRCRGSQADAAHLVAGIPRGVSAVLLRHGNRRRGRSSWSSTIAQVLLGAGMAFHSGTDASFHYDSLAATGREAEYAPREAHVSRIAFIGSAVAALAGGAVGLFDLRYAYGLSALATIGMLIIVIIFREPTTHEKRSLPASGFFRQLRACGSYLHQPMLAWIFLFSVLMVVLNHVPYEFYQPYTRLVGGQAELMGENTPMIAGVHMALVMFIASFVAGWSVRLRDRLGLGGALLTATALQTIIIAVMGFVLHPLVLVLVLLRSVPRALMTAPVNAAVTPRVEQAHRATYASLQSLAGRLSFSMTLVGLSLLSVSNDRDDWASLSRMQLVAAGVGVLGLLVLGFSARRGLRVDDGGKGD